LHIQTYLYNLLLKLVEKYNPKVDNFIDNYLDWLIMIIVNRKMEKMKRKTL